MNLEMALSKRKIVASLFIMIWTVSSCAAQELVPRRWSSLPIGVNFAGGGYAYTDAEIEFDPVLRIENVTLDMDTYPIKYIRTFEFAGKTARIDWMQAYQDARWNGLLDGQPASVARSGWSDMSFRFAVNLIGSPPLSAKEFAKYQSEIDGETIVGAGLIIQLPTGHYLEDKLLNLGTNRVTFRPQLGVVKRQGKWATEATISSWIYTDNADFFDGNHLEQDPFFTIQGHVDYTFRPGLWLGGGLGYGAGARSTINDVLKDDRKENLAWIVSLAYSITPKTGVKVSYVGIESLTNIGADSNSVVVAMSVLW